MSKVDPETTTHLYLRIANTVMNNYYYNFILMLPWILSKRQNSTEMSRKLFVRPMNSNVYVDYGDALPVQFTSDTNSVCILISRHDILHDYSTL